MSVTPDRRRPRELDDPVWLKRQYQQRGDQAIADELGVAYLTVRRARDRLGIMSHPRGRRRGVVATIAPASQSHPTAMLIATRFAQECRGAPAPSFELLLSRLVNVDRARKAGDDEGVDDALIALASAAGLVFEHRQRLRLAA